MEARVLAEEALAFDTTGKALHLPKALETLIANRAGVAAAA